ncbi:MAG: hypothetical protein ACREJJ_07360, partial [Candidatus Methylomirabilales bacterium]
MTDDRRPMTRGRSGFRGYGELSRAVHSSGSIWRWAVWALPLTFLVAASSAGEETITAGALLEEVRIVASPAMAGRGVGTPGIEKTAEHIAREFQQAGL